MTVRPRVAVIGGGAGGLATTKALVDVGAEVVTFEKGDRPGGLWARDNSSGLSAAYASLHLNTSKGRTEFTDFPMPDEWPDYPSADHVAGYLAAYADRFDLTRRIRYCTEVERVDRNADGWTVTDDRGSAERFDAVVVANGHNWDPRWPSPGYPGTFAGLQMHAHDYRTPEVFRDQRVLVVGMGNSAMDITVDASYVSNGPVMLSSRHGVHIVPKYIFGRPSDKMNGILSVLPWRARQRVAETMLKLAVGRPQDYGLPAPTGGLFQNHPTISDTILHRLTHGEVVGRPSIARFDGNRVFFTDGGVETVDVIVWATGYKVTIPFLSDEWLGEDPEELPLYRRVFSLRDPSLMFVGLIQSTGAALPVLEAQAALVAAQLSGRYALPTPYEQEKSVAKHFAYSTARWGNDRRPRMRIDFDGYIAEVAKEIRAGGERQARDSQWVSAQHEGVTA